MTGAIGNASKAVPNKQGQGCTSCTTLTGERSIGIARHDNDLLPSVNLGSPLPPDMEMYNSAQADDQSVSPVENVQFEQVGPNDFPSSSGYMTPSKIPVQGAGCQNRAFLIPESFRESNPRVSIPVQTSQVLQQHHLPILVRCVSFSESCQPWSASFSAEDALCMPDNVTPVPVATWNGNLEKWQQPLQEFPPGLDHDDPWSSLGHHPISSPILVKNTHPHHEGYGSILKAQDDDANVGTITQHQKLNGLPGNIYEHTADENFEGLASFAASKSNPSTFIAASDCWSSDPSAAPSPKPPPSAQPHVARSLPGGTQFDFDSRTGQQLTASRAKRRQSKEEKASSQRIRRRGGPCDICRHGHRKCDPSHPKPGSLSSSKLGPGRKAKNQWHSKVNIAEGNISKPGMQRSKLVRSGDHGGAASQPCHESKGSYLPRGPTSSNRTSPPGNFPASQSSVLSDSSFFPFGSVAPPDQHAVTPLPMRAASPNPFGVEEMCGSTDTSLLPHSHSESAHTRETPPSSVDYSSLWGNMDDEAPSVDHLNTHRYSYVSLEQVELPASIFAGLDVDFTSFEMDIIGAGEQFIGSSVTPTSIRQASQSTIPSL
ncbi:hypothetical protein EPUS_09156 [Endocarpon pusillum Z07020]|uniref:Zn(2)-C6 fungal-type domain-containing protein n=1 Tax=Endocarpon pusillum (strain Z07020 / HMAS-L-300199) TaxID=1263415 RepID=U1GLQ3_ENDPU|nr:uncharacterized protein EPUS_09156 [Endocarpon pusillum Z07020]ERF73138.1 hypothetical protein EPUS_09156 [Endocarpon pusillum Z07020]